MKKLLLFVVIGLIVVAVGVNWYYTRQIRDQLDRMANAVSMFGTLSYDGVRLTPGGAVNINDLSFRLHQGRGGIDIGRISLQTANLLSLLTLESQLERGRLPEALGLRVDNIQVPLDGALATMARDVPGNTPPPVVGSGFLFDAAGCGDRTQFSANDLMHMDYFDIRADVEAHYQLIDDGTRLRLLFRARTYEANTIYLEATLDLPSGSLTARDLTRSMENARLDSASLGYEDLGFYERMLDFCAEEMDMTRAEYIAHHLEAWRQAWSRLDAQPAPEVMAAYESFIKDPQQLSVSSHSENDVSIDAIDRYALSELLERMDVRLIVNHGEPQPLDLRGLEESPARVASSEQPAENEDDVPRSEPDDEPPASATDVTETDTMAAAANEPATRWIQVDPADIGTHRGQRLRVRMKSGDQYSGRLSRVDSENIHIRVEGVGGFYVRPLPRGEIREMEAYDDR